MREEVLNELERLNANKVMVLGGPNAISTDVETKLQNKGYEVERIAGTTRIETNQKINERLKNVNGVLVASSRSFPDALGAAPIATIKNWAIVLTRSNAMDKKSFRYLNFENVAIVGGPGAISREVEAKLIDQNGKDKVVRLAGTNRYETLASVLNYFEDDIHSNKVLVATGQRFPDALTASSLSVKSDAPLILVKDNKIDPEIAAFLEKYGKENVVENLKTIGGVLSEETINDLSEKVK